MERNRAARARKLQITWGMKRRKTPVRALLEGLAAGAIGAGAQSLYFRLTERITPKAPEEAFDPPEGEQAQESALETTARRLVEGLAQRGPLDARQKERIGEVVHYGFGAAWGGIYGLVRASYPRAWSVRGIAGFAIGVWMLGDNLLLPALRLAGWPQRYPVGVHAHALGAHAAYGAGVALGLAAIDRAPLVPLVAAFALARGRRAGRRVAAAMEGHALVPREVVEAPRHLARALARRARDLSR